MGVLPPHDPPAPEGDDSISNDMLLYRWVSRYEIIPDGNLGRYRPTSNAFHKTKGTNEMSVVLDDRLRADGRTPLDLVGAVRTAGSFTAGFVRSECGEDVVRAPAADEPAHGNVIGGEGLSSKEKKRLRDKLACEAVCVEGEWEAASLPRS